MLQFLLYTIIAWLATACLTKILFISIQPGQWLDKLLNWQQRLREWDMQGKEFLVKAGGLCEVCFSHMITFLSFWAYVFFMNQVLQVWVTNPLEGFFPMIVVNVIWYLCYVSIGSILSLYFITKLFRQ